MFYSALMKKKKKNRKLDLYMLEYHEITKLRSKNKCWNLKLFNAQWLRIHFYVYADVAVALFALVDDDGDAAD